MSAFAGPEIIVNGLTSYLDAGNPKSYPGTGTVWYDLSGNNNNGTLVNGVTYSTNNKGLLVLTGTSSQYIEVLMDYRTLDYTFIGASRILSGSGRTFSAKNNNWLMGHHAGLAGKHYAAGWVYSVGTTGSNWNIFASTGSPGSDLYSYYENGTARVVDSILGTSGPYNFAIGSYAGTTEFATGEISFFLAYNRILTQEEINQNFISLRGRFDL